MDKEEEEALQRKVEELNERVARYFEDENDNQGDKPPIIKSPPPTTDGRGVGETSNDSHILRAMVSTLQGGERRKARRPEKETESPHSERRGCGSVRTIENVHGLYVFARYNRSTQ